MGIIDQENNNVVTEENSYQNQFTTVIEISICQTYDDQCHSHTYGKVSMSHLWIIQYVTPIKKEVNISHLRRSQYVTYMENYICHTYGKVNMSYLRSGQYVRYMGNLICPTYISVKMSYMW